ncbi:MAG: ester cyclase [Gammaproteobacteria bacterium]|nr:ester cyclase [Gammaproteobacteria bacterium]
MLRSPRKNNHHEHGGSKRFKYFTIFAIALGALTGCAPPSVSNGLKTNESAEPVEVSGISLLRFADSKITEEIVHYDTATLNAKLGKAEVPHAK